MFCASCGLPGTANTTCTRCGLFVGAPARSPLASPVVAPTRTESRHILILIFGILSICVVFLFGPFAWAMGRTELKRIDAGELPREGRGMALAGMICGIVGCGIGALQILFFLTFWLSWMH